MNAKKTRIVLLSLLAAASVHGAWIAESRGDKPPAAARSTTHEARLARGAQLVTTSGCHDCHTPLKMGEKGPEPDMTRMLSGHPESLVMPAAPSLPPGPWLVTVSATNTAWAGPWGVSYTANLTPDKETGIGTWTLRTFIETIRNGRHMGRGRPLLPPMPWPMYRHLSDEDLEAIFAFLGSIAPIHNQVPQNTSAPAPAHASR